MKDAQRQEMPQQINSDGSILSEIFRGCEGLIEIRPLPPNRKHPAKFFKDPVEAAAYALSVKGAANVYFGAGTRLRKRGTKADVKEVPGLWADCDSDESVSKLDSFGLKPTIVVETSPGRRQAWWLFEQPILVESDGTIAMVEGVLKSIAKALGADRKCTDLPHVLRLPGTANVKRGGVLCQLLQAGGSRYNLQDFLQLGIGPDPKLDAARKSGSSTRLDTARVLAGVPEGERDEQLYKLACKLRNADVPQDVAEKIVLDAAAKCSPRFDSKVAIEKVKRAYTRFQPSGGGAASHDSSDIKVDVVPWPDPPAIEAYCGLPGGIVGAIYPHTEADEVAILVQILVAFGSVIGRGAHFRVEADYHHTNLFAVLVGATSKGRKGTSWGQAKLPFFSVDSDWATERVKSGLSSGEGLIWAVRDKIERKDPVKVKGRVIDYETVIADHGVTDKRLLVLEPEFASVLRVTGREGNTLSPIIRQAYDTGILRTLTKNTPAVATHAHISITGHITKDELLRHLDRTEMANGFANRFVWLCVRRSKLLPEGGRISEVNFEPIVRDLSEAVTFARGVKEIKRDEDARELWRQVYPDLSAGRPGLLGAVLSRAEAQVTRLSVIYAVMDRSDVVRKHHLLAALAVWKYSEASCRFIFGDAVGDPVADELLRALRAAPEGMTRTQIRDLFGKNKTAEQIGRALKILAEQGLAAMQMVETGGRPAECWSAVLPGERRDAVEDGKDNGGVS